VVAVIRVGAQPYKADRRDSRRVSEIVERFADRSKRATFIIDGRRVWSGLWETTSAGVWPSRVSAWVNFRQSPAADVEDGQPVALFEDLPFGVARVKSVDARRYPGEAQRHARP
jgi:hypothetical protein